MIERVVASNNGTETTEDLYERVKREHPLVYETVSAFIPEGWADTPRMAALITSLAVEYFEAKAPVGGKLAKLTLFGGSMAVLGGVIDITLGNEDSALTLHDVARSFGEAFAGQVLGLGITAGVAAIGVTGAGGVALAAGLTAGAMSLLSRGYDLFIDPYSKNKVDKLRGSFTATTVLPFADYFDYHWDDISEYDNWTLLSEKSSTEIWYRNSISTYQFSTPQIDEDTFYQILKHEDSSFGVIWDGAGRPVSDTVRNYYNFSVSQLKAAAESSNQALYALVSLRPFVLLAEQASNYNALDRSEYSDNYLQDRAQFLYCLIDDHINGMFETVVYRDYAQDIKLNEDRAPDRTIAFGGDEDDFLIEGTSYAWSGSHNDRLYGMGGNDHLVGYDGNDYLEGGKGTDTLDGGSGDDIFGVTADDMTEDTIDGGSGLDTLQFTDGVDAPTFGPSTKITNVEEIQLLKGDDTLTLNDGAVLENYQEINGGTGNDIFKVIDLKVKTFEAVQNFEELVVAGSLTVQKLLPEDFPTITFTGSGTLNADSEGADIDLTGVTVTGLDSIVGGDGDDSIQLGDNTVGQISLGAGDDTFRGGGIIQDSGGRDIYYLNGSSTIDDSDGRGLIILNKSALLGGTYNEEATQAYQQNHPDATVYTSRSATYIYDPTNLDYSLIIKSGGEEVKIKGFVKDSASRWLRIRLEDESDESEPPEPPEPKGLNDGIPGSPLILDLDGDGVETVGLDSGIQFDLDNNGFRETLGWAGVDDGLLALDRDNDGRITNGTELFGNYTPTQDGSTAANGFLALAQYDNNGDGWIDGNDDIFSQLRVWQDGNQNGASDAGELLTLAEAGVSRLNLDYTDNSSQDENGNAYRQIGSYIATDGASRELTDVWFKTNPTLSQPVDDIEVPEDIQLLPDAVGFGNVRSLHEAMALDENLKALVEQFANESNRDDRNALVPEILFQWVGRQESNAPNSYQSVISRQKMAVLESFWGGRNFEKVNGSKHANQLATRYRQLEDMVFYQLISQTHLKEIYGLISFSFDESRQVWTGDYSLAMETIFEMAVFDPETAANLALDLIHGAKGMNPYIGDNETSVKQLISDFISANEQNRWIHGFIIEFNQNYLRGGDGNDTLFGWKNDDELFGMSGDDSLYGAEGADSLNGGDGNDTLCGEVGADILVGNDGSDLLFGGDGDDCIFGNNRYSSHYSSEEDNDILDGGIGNDRLYGGYGNDRYRFDIGSGQDTLLDSDGQADAVVFGENIHVENIEAYQIDQDMFIQIKGNDDTLTIKNWFHYSR